MAGANTPDIIKPDLLHCFSLGVCGDMATSTIVGLARMKVFEGRSLDSRLDHAFALFEAWCRDNHETASVKEFDKAKFHMTSLPSPISDVILGVLLRFSGPLFFLG